MGSWRREVGRLLLSRRWDVLAVVALASWLLLDLTGKTVFGSTPWPLSVVDFRIIYDASQYVLEHHRYPPMWPYPYPPSAVVMQAAFGVFPFSTAAAVWLTLMGLAALACYATPVRMLGLHRRPGSLLLLPLAHVAVSYYFQWDMRSVNCNLIMAAAVILGCAALARGRDALAGFWFALAVALKVLPILLLPYLAWTRRWRALASAALFSCVFWVALPLVAFGTDGFSKVFAGWGDELTRAADRETKQSHPILISLDRAALHVTNQDPAGARAIRVGVCALWVVVGLAGAAASWRRSRDGFSILAHASLLVIGPAAANPYLEPYHLILLAVPAVLLLAAATDPRQRTGVRLLAAAGFVIGLASLKASSSWPIRGLLVNAEALVLCATTLAVAWMRTEQPPTSGTPPLTSNGSRRSWVRRLLAARAGA